MSADLLHQVNAYERLKRLSQSVLPTQEVRCPSNATRARWCGAQWTSGYLSHLSDDPIELIFAVWLVAVPLTFYGLGTPEFGYFKVLCPPFSN